jgi:hypothetical protein
VKTLADPQVKQEIVARLRRVEAAAQRRWGKMTAPQMVCHVADAFRAACGERAVSPAKRIPLRRLVKFGALYLPLPWPHGVPTLPEMDQRMGGTPPANFSADIAELQRLLDKFTANPRGFEWPPHPIFPGMSQQDWMRWGYLHTDHHLRQFGV